MKFRAMSCDGTPLSRRMARAVAYTNRRAAQWVAAIRSGRSRDRLDEVEAWARRDIEEAVVNIARSAFADRVE